jgi:hypothetical protein
MITVYQRKNKCSWPKIKSIEEKRLKLLRCPLVVLEISIIYFPRKAPQEARKHHKTFHKAQATSHWRRKWSIDSPFLKHIQHLKITMTCRFLRLSMDLS